MVAAAGNDYLDNDLKPRFYPASLDSRLSYLLRRSTKKGYSIMIMHSGEELLTWLPRAMTFSVHTRTINTRANGCTSMATAFASGTAALVWGYPAYHELKADQLKRLLIRSVGQRPDRPDWLHACASGGVLDVGFLITVEQKSAQHQ